MNRTPRFLTSIAALATTAVLAGCSVTGITGTTSTAASTSSTTSSSTTASATTTATATTLAADTTVAAARAANASVDVADTTWNATGATTIALNGSTATVSGAGATVSGNTVTITAGGTYVLSGSFTGQVVVNSASDDEVKIVLNGASITSTTTSALAFVDAGEAVVVLADGTTNTLTDATTYADTAEDAATGALYSKADLTIGGNGTLKATGNAADGIVGKDGVAITGGTITVDAKDDGIRGKDYVAVSGGTLTVTAGGDAIKSTNTTDAGAGFVDISGGTLNLTAGTKSGDGIDAVNSIIIAGGHTTVLASYEGLEALNIVIGGGETEVTSADDGLNVSQTKTSTSTTTASSSSSSSQGPGAGGGDTVINGTASISGGTLTLHADGDGLDSNGSASITGGTVIVDQSGGGNGALDVNGTFTISGGTLVAVGDASMPVAPNTSSAQGWVMASASGNAGDQITIKSGDTVVAQFTATRAFGNVVYSSSAIKSGSSYTVTAGSATTTVTADQAVSGNMGGGPRR